MCAADIGQNIRLTAIEFRCFHVLLLRTYFFFQVSGLYLTHRKLAKTGHGPHSSKLVVICVVLLLFVLFYLLFVCKCVLYYSHRVTTHFHSTNISYHLSYHIISYRKSLNIMRGAKCLHFLNIRYVILPTSTGNNNIIFFYMSLLLNGKLMSERVLMAEI
jgi:hypothetical protein